jgi:hypothetical protein
VLAVGFHEAFECGCQAEVVESGRPELDRQSAHILKRGHDELAQGGDTLPSLVRVDRLLERLQPEQDGGERLPVSS